MPGHVVVGQRRDQSSGSTLTIEAPWLLPTQKVGGLVVLSTKERRMSVSRGSGYSTACPVCGSSRTIRSVVMPPVQASPFLSVTTSYGCVCLVGNGHSWIFSALVSNIVTLLPRYCANQKRSWSSRRPRRLREKGVPVW